MVTLNRFSAGMITYVAAHNANMTTIETALNNLLTALGLGTGTTGTAAGMDELWEQDGLVGASAFPVACATSQTLSVGSGAAWILGTQAFSRSTSSVTLNFAGKTSGIYAVIVDGAGTLSFSALSAGVVGSSLQLYSIEYKAGTFGSAARLLPILLQGNDWQRMLSSVNFGSFARVADRLSAAEGALTLDTLYAQSAITSGVNWHYKAGHVRDNNTIVSTTGSNVLLNASATNYIEVTISTGTVSYTITGFTSNDAIPLRKISTAASAVLCNYDVRTWAFAGGASGGGVAGLANSGTTDGIWYLYRGTGSTSAPVSTAAVAVDRGSQATVEVRWNESTDAWQYTNDGTTYYGFGEIAGLDLGAGQTTRWTMIASAPAVLAAEGLTTTTSTVAISLSGIVSTTTTAILLRGTAFDSAASVLAASAEPFPGVAFYRDSSTVTANAVARILADINSAVAERAQMVMVPVSNQLIEYAAVAASDLSLRCSVYAVAYVDLVTGPGPQVASATVTGLTASVGANAFVLSSGQFSGFVNRGLVTYLEVSGTLGAGSLYDIEFYSSDGAAASQLLFQAIQVDASAAYTTRVPFAIRALPSNNSTFLRLSNAGASAGTFSVHWSGERFA